MTGLCRCLVGEQLTALQSSCRLREARVRYGWRARIGQIRPSTGIESSEEWRSVAPKGVAFIDARTFVREVSERGLEEMMAQVVDEAKKCASARADVIVQCGTPGVFLKGVGYDDQVIAAMEKARA